MTSTSSGTMASADFSWQILFQPWFKLISSRPWDLPR